MKLSQFLSIITVITAFCIFYVYQQTEVFRLAYTGQKKMVVFEELLDKNSVLRYNINQNASLVRIGNKVLAVSDFQMPDNYRFIRLASSKESPRIIKRAPSEENMISRLFAVKRQAEAKTISR